MTGGEMNCEWCGTHIAVLKPHPKYCPRFKEQVTIDFSPDLGHGTFFLLDDGGWYVAELSGKDLENVRLVGLPTYTLHDCPTNQRVHKFD
jgi:hypothetical protein